MSRVRRGRGGWRRLRFGASDGSLTGCSGLVALAALCDRLGVVGCLDRHVGSVKGRDRGLSAGELLTGLACAQLVGLDTLSGLDRLRADAAGQELAPARWAASTTAGTLARRFGPAQLAGVEAAVGVLAARWVDRLPAQRRAEVCGRGATIDLDPTDTEVYGRCKDGVARNYQGQLAGRPHLASWAEAGLPLAAELLAGNDDVRPCCADLLTRAVANLPTAVCGRVRVRADAGYFCAELAHAALAAGADFAVAAKRNPALWRAYGSVPEQAWRKARDMHGAQVAAVDYAPAGWPPGSYTIIRRVRVAAEEISADPRSRRRRTIPAGQLRLALGGHLDQVWAVSFIVTNIPADDGADIVGLEAWFRGRADIETRIKEAKLGAALRRLPSGDRGVNSVWMWAALLAGLLSVMLQSLTGLDTDRGRGHAARLRHQLLCIPARLIHHARRLTLRLPPGRQLLPTILARLHALPAT